MRVSYLSWVLVLSALVVIVEQGRTQSAASRSGTVVRLVQASRWRQRVLLLCAPTAADATLRRQGQLLAPARAGLAERHVLVREVVLEALSAADRQYLTETLRVPPGAFMVLLIGKDGGVKRRAAQPLLPAALFATIDGMPMRQQEMREARRP